VTLSSAVTPGFYLLCKVETHAGDAPRRGLPTIVTIG
jgi:hypothetical protein